MSSRNPRSLIRRIYVVLGIFFIGSLLYHNFVLYSITKSLKRAQLKTPKTASDASDAGDEISMALAALEAENRVYRANLKRQETNLKECMSKLPKSEVDDFYKRHQEELEQEMAK